MGLGRYLGTRSVLGLEQERDAGDEGYGELGKVLRGGWRRLLKLQGPLGAAPGLAQLDGAAHHLRVRLRDQGGQG